MVLSPETVCVTFEIEGGWGIDLDVEPEGEVEVDV